MTDAVDTMQHPARSDEANKPGKAARRRRGGMRDLTRNALSLREGQVGLALVLLILFIAFAGPLLAPYNPGAVVGMPFSPPGADALLGTDNLGRDVLSRFLNGGNVMLILAFLAATLGVGLGTVLGLTAGYLRGLWGSVIMRTLDIVLSFPSLLLALLFLSILGAKSWIIVLTVAMSHVPYVARVVESSSLAVTGRKYVQYAEMIGVSRWRILWREIFPGIIAPLTVQFGLRVTWSIGTIASLAFLGFGRQAPAIDWGVMVNENQASIVSNPLSALVPVAGIALITIGTNLLTDAYGQAAGINMRRKKTS